MACTLIVYKIYLMIMFNYQGRSDDFTRGFALVVRIFLAIKSS